MQIIKIQEANFANVINILNKGGLVIFPCETVYGIGCDCQNSKALEKLNKYKQRPLGKPYAIMAADQKMAEEYVRLNETALNLYKKFLPGPLTVVSTGIHKTASGVESETGSLGVRIPNYKFMLELIKNFGRPIVATSANTSYQKRPYKISDILDNISEKQKKLIDLVIDAGELEHNEPSTVIDTTMDDPIVLRQGEIVISDQSSVVSRSEENTRNTGKEMWQKYEKFAGQRAIVFALEGPMGAGKTVFTKGLARAIGIRDEILSPTYNLQLNYQFQISNFQSNHNIQKSNSKTLSHIDAWRMQNGQELEALGMKGLINDKSIIVIEWADRVAEVIRKYNEQAVVVWVKIEYGPTSPKATKGKENERIISWGVL